MKEGATVVAVYEYDGLARRVKKHLDSESPGSPDGIDAYVHTFYNRGWQVLETRRSGSENTGPESLQPEYQYVWSLRYIDAPVLRDENTDADSLCDDDRKYYLDDANFNVTTLVDTAGDALERYVYSPYGVLTVYDATWSNIRSDSSYAVEYTYTGRRLDPETGLYYYRQRMYHSQLGRFVSRDPVGYRDCHNLLQYAVSRPLTVSDPSGLLCVKTGAIYYQDCGKIQWNAGFVKDGEDGSGFVIQKIEVNYEASRCPKCDNSRDYVASAKCGKFSTKKRTEHETLVYWELVDMRTRNVSPVDRWGMNTTFRPSHGSWRQKGYAWFHEGHEPPDGWDKWETMPNSPSRHAKIRCDRPSGDPGEAGAPVVRSANVEWTCCDGQSVSGQVGIPKGKPIKAVPRPEFPTIELPKDRFTTVKGECSK